MRLAHLANLTNNAERIAGNTSFFVHYDYKRHGEKRKRSKAAACLNFRHAAAFDRFSDKFNNLPKNDNYLFGFCPRRNISVIMPSLSSKSLLYTFTISSFSPPAIHSDIWPYTMLL